MTGTAVLDCQCLLHCVTPPMALSALAHWVLEWRSLTLQPVKTHQCVLEPTPRFEPDWKKNGFHVICDCSVDKRAIGFNVDG